MYDYFIYDIYKYYTKMNPYYKAVLLFHIIMNKKGMLYDLLNIIYQYYINIF